MAFLEPEPGKLRLLTTNGPAADRVTHDRASGTPDALRELRPGEWEPSARSPSSHGGRSGR
ncbi:hypothetical protein ACFV80_45145 [Streptomyces sp. NPDC059862]|uniref:hypothetical protein n=1 Tax=Streptomyces sp. NPDC059862 TaxID=3346975 RepID=UPI00365C8D5C